MKKLITLLLIAIFTNFASAERANLTWVQNWDYWLQDINIEELKNNSSDLVVIDYSKDGSSETAFTKEEIQSLKDEGKVVLAYLSIGEAEDYRFYWKDSWNANPPSFLGEENPEWAGNYKVKYWERSWWRQVIRPYLKKITAAGFDGVYLDIIDGYYYYGEKDGKLKKRANQMVRLVEKIARFGRKKAGEKFAVFPQNGSSILDDASKKFKNRYIKTIDGIGIESLYYNIYNEADKNYRIEKLKELTLHNKLILDVEYISESKYDEYFDTVENSELNIVAYPAHPDTALDELIIPYQ